MRILFISVLFVLLPLAMSAQISGSSVFLQGVYVEVAINECGVYGSDEEPPIGPWGDYHDLNWNGLGYIADHEKDGWDVSTEPGQPIHCGDYSAPGTPEEGWAIQIADSVFENHNFECYGYSWYGWDSIPSIPGSNVAYIDSGGVKMGIWEGTLVWDPVILSIRQITYLPDAALYFISKVEITNESDLDLTDVYYMRNMEHDQDVDLCGDYSTHSSVISNTPDSDTSYLTSIGDACGCFVGVVSIDPRARVSWGSFFLYPNKPSDAYNGVMPYSISGDTIFDGADQITYRFDLAAGESTFFTHARVFGPTELDAAINELEDLAEPTVFADGVALPSDTVITICEGESVNLNIVGFEIFDWVWEPASYLDTTGGTVVTTIPEESITYTATASGVGYSYMVEVPIVVSQDMELSLSSTPSFEGTATGSVSVEITSGGIPPYSIEWTSGDTTATSTGLEPGGYVVWVTDSIGCTATQSVSVGISSEIQSIIDPVLFSVYPNPASEELHVQFLNEMSSADLVVVAMNGSEMIYNGAITEKQITLDVSNWNRGVYFVKLCTDVGCQVEVVMIQ